MGDAIDVSGVKMEDKSFGRDNHTFKPGRRLSSAKSENILVPTSRVATGYDPKYIRCIFYCPTFCSLACNCARLRSAASKRSLIAFSSLCSFSFSSLSFRRFDFRF